jgi:DNA gyrase subunit A
MSDELELPDGNGGGQKIMARMLEDEMRESFIDYSMSVIVQRALPDVRDGLKPVHRRILYAMMEAGMGPGRAYKKSATVVGDVLGKYHPHGDIAVYDSMVRMVQDFSLRYPLIDGQGNFGSVDGDPPAAMRYTECRMARISSELLADLDKDTVDWQPNYDDKELEPLVVPNRVPNLLVNGSSGIAVGMATNIPPHNLREIVDACTALIDDEDLPDDQLEAIVRGPDFPTGGFICGLDGVRDAYRTGRGRIVMRARAEIEKVDAHHERIIVTEIPFMVNKSRLVEQVAQLVRDKKLTDIRDLRDESDRDGMRVVIELKRDCVPHIVLNQLYKHTQMQSTFGAILLALVDGQPKIMPLRDMLRHFVAHRLVVIVRRSEYDLEKALDREHILEGLKIAVDNIDEVIKIIRGASDPDAASQELQDTFELTERQAKAILDMRLARLTGLEIEKLEEELEEVRALIGELRRILGSEEVRMGILKDELREIADKYGDERRTEITGAVGSFDVEDLIVEEDMVVTVSHQGYVKRLPIGTYRAQRRGGRGLRGMDTKEEDWVEHLFVASTHDYLMIFTRDGTCYWKKVWEIPVGGRTSRGKPIVNLLNVAEDQQVAAVVPVRDFRDDQYLLFGTRLGVVKKTVLSAYGNVRNVGLNAITINEGDELIEVQITSGDDEVILASRGGMAIRFHESDVRPMGRTAAGVRGLKLRKKDVVVGMVVVRPDSTLLVVAERGLGKRTDVEAYRFQRRGGSGVINLKVSAKTGEVVAVKAVRDDEQLMIITRNGVVNRQRVAEISVIGRATQGVKLVNLDEGDSVVDVARVVTEDESGDDEGAGIEDAIQAVEAAEGGEAD